MAGNRKPSPTKPQIAEMKALSDIGLSPYAIAQRLSCKRDTVTKYLEKTDFSDPLLSDLVKKIKQTELAEAEILGAKARLALNNYLDDVIEGTRKPEVIPIVAIADRFFNQKRLLSGESTSNMEIHHTIRAIKEFENKHN